MSSRKYVDDYEYKSSSQYNDVISLVKALQEQIRFILKNEYYSEWLEKKLEELNNLEIFFHDYFRGSGILENYQHKLLDESITYMFKKHPDGSSPKSSDVVEFYNQSEIYCKFKKYLDQLYSIEDEIHEKITVELWKKYCTPIASNFRQGDQFRYIVHSGYNIIKLPGLPGHQKNRHVDGDFVSASLISNEQMHMYNGNVGLILEPNESIIASSRDDSGTRISEVQGLNSILDFGNGTYVNTRLDYHVEEIPTKIQSPGHLHTEFMKELDRRNVDALDEGWPINEVILDDSRIKVIGVFFRVDEHKLALHDFVRAHNMSVMYKVPLRIVNVERYKKQNEKQNEEHNYEKLRNMIREQIKDNYDLIRLYYSNVVWVAEFGNEAKNIFREEIERYLERDIGKNEDDVER